MGGVRKYIAYAATAAIFVAPALVMGAGLVPCGDKDPTSCTWGSVVAFANTFLNFLIGIGVVIAGVLIAVAGIKLLLGRGDPGAWKAAKQMMTNVIIGMAIMILAFTIIKVLLTTFGVQGKFRATGL
jgi:hypothetical protein